MTFDLIIPVYNPPSCWEISMTQTLDKLLKQSRDLGNSLEHIIIVNDGSIRNFTNKETDFLKSYKLPLKVISYVENRGKGFALREGIKESISEHCIYTDSDFPFGIESITSTIEKLKNGFDIVAGCRNRNLYYNKTPFKRRVVSKMLMAINKHILKLDFDDTQAGIKGFNSSGKELFLKTSINRFLFDLEFILLATSLQQINLTSIDVTPLPGIQFSNFKTKILLQESLNLCKLILKRKKIKDAKKDIAWV